MVPLELIIIEDDECLNEAMSAKAENAKLNYESFTSGVMAFDYLKRLSPNELPLNYLCDMKLLVHGQYIKNELKAPEEIFWYVKDYGSDDRLKKFYFMTGNLSEYDLAVQERTKAKVLMKPFESTRKLDEICKQYTKEIIPIIQKAINE